MNIEVILFSVFPYVALAIHLTESIRRYRQVRFSFSSLSSQFLEGERLFLGSVPWHYGILWVLGGHLVAFLFPAQIRDWNSVPIRLYILEFTALVAGLITLIGLVNLIMRRVRHPRIRSVTSVMDIIILALLLLQVILGLYIATSLRWGSNWYCIVLVPYLHSLCAFQPDLTMITPMPLAVKLHILGAWVLLSLLPFTRLVHFLVVPWQYIWRRPQVVIWNRNPKSASNP